MSRQGARLPGVYRGASNRDDQAPRSSAGSSAGAGGRGRGRGAQAKKTVFQPSVRALPLGTQATAPVDVRDKKDRSGHSGLLLINKKPTYAAADPNGLRLSGPECSEHADSDAATRPVAAANPWAARIRPRANTTECVSSSAASANDAVLDSERNVVVGTVPLAEASLHVDDMLDSGIEFADAAEPDYRQHSPAQPEPAAAQRHALVAADDIDAAAREPSEPEQKTEPASVSAPAPAPAPTSAPAPAPAPTALVSESEDAAAAAPQPARTAPKAAEIWGRPQKEASAPIQLTQPQPSRWWKASLSGGSAPRPPAASSSPAQRPSSSSDGQPRRHVSLKLGAMQKPDSDSSAKPRPAKAASEAVDAKGKRSFGRRQTAPIPTVMPPVLLSKAMARPKDHLLLGAAGPVSRANERPSSASGEKGIADTTTTTAAAAAAAGGGPETASQDLRQETSERQALEAPLLSLASAAVSATDASTISNSPASASSGPQNAVAAKPEGDTSDNGEPRLSLVEPATTTPAGPRASAQKKPTSNGSKHNSSSGSNGAAYSDNWRAGSRPRLQQHPNQHQHQHQHQQAPTQVQSQELDHVDPSGTWRRTANVTKNVANRLSLNDKADRPSSKTLSTGSWRASPGSLKQKASEEAATAAITIAAASTASVATAASKVEALSAVKPSVFIPPLSIAEPPFIAHAPSSARSEAISGDTQDSSRILRADRQRSQTQSVGSALTQSNHDFYYGSVGSGLRNAPDADRSQLNDLLQIKPPVSSASSGATHPPSSSAAASANIKSEDSSGNIDNVASAEDGAAMPPLLPHKILADILGGDEVPVRNSARSSNGAGSNAPHPVKPIGGGSIKSAVAAAADKVIANNPAGSSRKETDNALGRNKLGYSSSSLFQITDNSLLTSAYSVAGRPALEGTYSVDQSPIFWQQQQNQNQQQQKQINVGFHGAQNRYGYIYQQSGFTSSVSAQNPPVSHDQAQKDSSAPPFKAFSAVSVNHQWAYSQEMPPQIQTTYHQPYADSSASGLVSSSGQPGPPFSTLSAGTGMIWSDPNQALVDAPSAVQPFRNPADGPRTPSRGDGAGQRGYKSSGKQPRPIGTRSTPSGGHHVMRNRQEDGAPQQQDHHVFDQISHQQHQHQTQHQFVAPAHSQHMHLQSWLPQYSGIQPQLYMHGPAAGYGVPSPHQSPQVAVLSSAGASVISPYMAPHHHHMMDVSSPHNHYTPMQSSTPGTMNGVHAKAENGKGSVADDEHPQLPLSLPSSFASAAPLHYMSKPAQQSSPQNCAYAYPVGPISAAQHHPQHQHQQQHQQLGFMQYAQPLYAEPLQMPYSPMYMGQAGVVQGSCGTPSYYLHNELQQMPIAANQQQQQQQQSSLSLSATPFQPSALSKQQQQQQQYQPSRQRGRSRGLELIEQSDRAQAEAKKNDSADATVPDKDRQAVDSYKSEVVSNALSGAAKEKTLSNGVQSESAAKTSSESANGSSQNASASAKESRDQRSGRTQDRKGAKHASKAAEASLPPAVAAASDASTQQKNGESKRRHKQDRSRKPAKSASATASDLLPGSSAPAAMSTENGASRGIEKSQKNARGGNRSSRGSRRSQAASTSKT